MSLCNADKPEILHKKREKMTPQELCKRDRGMSKKKQRGRIKADTVLSVRFKVRTFIVPLMNSVLDLCRCLETF